MHRLSRLGLLSLEENIIRADNTRPTYSPPFIIIIIIKIIVIIIIIIIIILIIIFLERWYCLSNMITDIA